MFWTDAWLEMAEFKDWIEETTSATECKVCNNNLFIGNMKILVKAELCFVGGDGGLAQHGSK